MTGGIKAIFNQYQQKHPLYTIDAIVELMIDDGVITFEIANKIRSGDNLFLLDSNLFKPTKNNDINITEIMGGNFTKTKPKTCINRRIESTFQGENSGDCWLLSHINALNYKDWGKKAIRDTIIPDNDGSGGVTIKFNGSPLKQKEIHITAQQIEEARKSSNYSSGDDDMVALELATEFTLREMVKLGLAKREYTDKELIELGYDKRSYLIGGISTDKYYQYPFTELLGIPSYYINFHLFNPRNNSNYYKDREHILKSICQNKQNIAMWCQFFGDSNNKYVHGNHAYAVKDLLFGEYAILTDPFNENIDIRMPWEDFENLLTDLILSGNNKQLIKNIQTSLPQYYFIASKEFNKRFAH